MSRNFDTSTFKSPGRTPREEAGSASRSFENEHSPLRVHRYRYRNRYRDRSRSRYQLETSIWGWRDFGLRWRRHRSAKSENQSDGMRATRLAERRPRRRSPKSRLSVRKRTLRSARDLLSMSSNHRDASLDSTRKCNRVLCKDGQDALGSSVRQDKAHEEHG